MRVKWGAIVTKEYHILLTAPEVEPLNKMKFSVISKDLFSAECEVLHTHTASPFEKVVLPSKGCTPFEKVALPLSWAEREYNLFED